MGTERTVSSNSSNESDYERMARLIMDSKRPKTLPTSKPDVLAYLDELFSGDTTSLEVRTAEWRGVRQYITDLEQRGSHETVAVATLRTMTTAIGEAQDLLECAQPAEHLEATTPDDWYAEREAWMKRNTLSDSHSEKASEHLYVPVSSGNDRCSVCGQPKGQCSALSEGDQR